ncbi:MAG TPA: NnrU family protein, partial [Pseudolabrys sp.]|nr:NnrU family protein [Pseudolabrys sp.]
VIFLVSAFIPCRIRKWLKHPMLTSVKTWALAHLLSNGDLGGIILFGSFLLWGGYSRAAAKRRGDLAAAAKPVPEGWANDIIVVVLGAAIFLALGYWFHPYVIGVSVFGR